jgi:hypothetical protein
MNRCEVYIMKRGLERLLFTQNTLFGQRKEDEKNENKNRCNNLGSNGINKPNYRSRISLRIRCIGNRCKPANTS